MPSLLRSVALPLCFAGSAALSAAEPRPLYLDPAQPQEARVQDLLGRMTLEERASLLNNTTPGVPRLGIPKYDWWNEALHGVANAGHATVFPQAIGLAAMWNEDLHGRIARVISREGRAKFNGYVGTPEEGTIFRGLTFWSPNINIFRDPRWGRGQETYGEDPFLTARLGVAFVRGLQGDDPRYLQAAACAKHFAVHSGPEPLRHDFDVSPSAADLHETYLPAFEALVRDGRVEVVMTAYNSLYGTPCSVSPLLYGKLREWGFNGHVTSDCGSLTDLIRTYARAKNDAEASALALLAGMNVCCGNEGAATAEAVRLGLIPEATANERVAGLLRTMFRLGFFDPKDQVPFTRIAPAENDSPEHGALAYRAARESLVLLKNDGVLPLRPEKLRRVLVVGPNASSVPVLVGNYNGTPSAPVTILAGLRAALEPMGVRVEYAHGCDYAPRPTTLRTAGYSWFKGEYFANADLAGAPAAEQWGRPLDFDFGATGPHRPPLPRGVPASGVSIRWSGTLSTTLAGDYEFLVRGRGGFRLKLGEETLLDAWEIPAGAAGTERELRVTRALGDNAELPLKLEYRQGDGPAKVAVQWRTPAADAGVAEAVARAQAADAIVFVGGLSAQLEGEEMPVDYEGFVGGDRTSIELPALQVELLERLHAAGKPIVFVNLSGSAVALPQVAERARAVVQAWYPGQAGGTAVADVLLGRYNPAGRLPVTFYRATADLPEFTDYRMAGRTYRYFTGAALYPFGHGLSFTTFRYANLRLAAGADGAVTATVEVTNTGARDGDEVVQLYATPPAAASPRELRALCGFRRVHVRAGETATVTLDVPRSALRRWDDGRKDYAVPAGDWTLAAGASSADLRVTATLRR